jgi:predicted hotdog family 3-hydroxylacyl-ACP dehydratase
LRNHPEIVLISAQRRSNQVEESVRGRLSLAYIFGILQTLRPHGASRTLTNASPSIEQLLPHKPPMRLLDTWDSRDESSIVCHATLSSRHSVVVREGVIDNGWCIELVAQAVAAYVGMQSWQNGAGPVMGFIVSCRDARFSMPSVPVDVPLRISAKHVWGERLLGSFRGVVERADTSEQVASVELGVFSGSLETGAFGEGATL